MAQSSHRERSPEGPAGRVANAGVGHLHDAVAERAHAETEVDVLGPVEDRSIESTHGIEHDTADQLARSDAEVDVPALRVRRTGHGLVARSPSQPASDLHAQRRRPPGTRFWVLVLEDRDGDGDIRFFQRPGEDREASR